MEQAVTALRTDAKLMLYGARYGRRLVAVLAAILALNGCAASGPANLAPVDERQVSRADGSSTTVPLSVIENNPSVRGTTWNGSNGASSQAGGSGAGAQGPVPESSDGLARGAPLESQGGAQHLQPLEPANTESDMDQAATLASVGAGLPPAHQNPAIQTLLEEANQLERRGDFTGASATIERALRISPNDASLWHRLAALKLRQGDNDQAQSFAKKSNALAGSDTELKARNSALIKAAARTSA